MKEVLRVEQVSKVYQRRNWWKVASQTAVLQQVSLRLQKGQVLGLVGESGCGKSTLCKIILGIEKPTSGTVYIEGQDTAQLTGGQWRALRRRMQVVYQDPYSSLDPRFCVRQILSEPLDIHKLQRDRTQRKVYLKELLRTVGLDEQCLTRYAHEFSGGQRQRLAIARALAVEPQILIADEPVSALDVSVQAQILNLLKHIVRTRGLSMLFVTHDFAVARFLCDEIAVMQGGRVVECATAQRIFTHPKQAYTRRLLAAVPRVENYL